MVCAVLCSVQQQQGTVWYVLSCVVYSNNKAQYGVCCLVWCTATTRHSMVCAVLCSVQQQQGTVWYVLSCVVYSNNKAQYGMCCLV